MNHRITSLAVLLATTGLLVGCNTIINCDCKHQPTNQAEVDTLQDAPAANNIALGKQVIGHVHQSAKHARPAHHLTDGNPQTDAYPGAFQFDYVIDLTTYAELNQHNPDAARGFDIDSITIDWGRYGRHFPGAYDPKTDAVVPSAYKADYINRYRVRYRVAGDDTWHTLHEAHGLPTQENDPRITVTRNPEDAYFDQGTVTTTLTSLALTKVTQLRVDARGAHWIGVYELAAEGKLSTSGITR